MGFDVGFWVCGFLIWLTVLGLEFWDLAKGLLRVRFFGIWLRVLGLVLWDLALGVGFCDLAWGLGLWVLGFG